MAVAAFNSEYNKSQQVLEKWETDTASGWGSGSAASNVKSMSGAQIDSFKSIKFMEQTQQTDERVKDTLGKRDKWLMQLDRTYLPQDSDWDAPKSFMFDKFTNYYGTLGLQDIATQEEIKQAYKRLSLVYHPDKTAGMAQEEKEKYAEIFIELRNAYATLMDSPTRRQYDAERIREMTTCEASGCKMKERKQFYGYEVLEVPVPAPEARPQFITERDGHRYCLLCNQWADDAHLRSKKHLKRAERPDWYMWDGRQEEQNERQEEQNDGGRGCSWCSSPAVARAIPGTKARYCVTCWDWWLRDGGGAAEAIPESFPIPSYGAPPLPPQRAPPLPPPDTTLRAGPRAPPLPPQRAPPRPSFAARWLDGEEICV